MFQKFIAKEKSYFNKLHEDARKLLISIFLYSLISPIFYVFINAFLWRQSHDILLVALYNAVVYAAVPLGFYLNGFLLRKFPAAVPYTFSALLISLSTGALIFLPSVSYLTIVIFGFIIGVNGGIYWGNRNLLTLKTTTSNDRIYFSSVEVAFTTIVDVLIPALLGWSITFGTFTHLYTPLQGYQLLVLYMLIVIVRLGFVSRKITTGKITSPVLFVRKVTNNWKKFRRYEFILGLQEAAITFVPVLLVLILVGKEETLGTIQSVSAILASLFIYVLGKSLNTKHRAQLIALGVFIAIVGAAISGIFYSAAGVLIFFASQALSYPFMWVAGNSINYDLIDNDNTDSTQHYAYVCDQEIYLNGGRVAGIVLFMLLLSLTSNTFALRFAPLIFIGTQVFLIFIVNSIEKRKR